MLLSIRKGGLPKASSLQHFEDYRRNEGSGSLASVNQEGTLLEYETLVSQMPNVGPALFPPFRARAGAGAPPQSCK